jgi:hypothetical protein
VPRGRAALAEDEQAEHARLEEEREQSFHRQRLGDHAAGDAA